MSLRVVLFSSQVLSLHTLAGAYLFFISKLDTHELQYEATCHSCLPVWFLEVM